MATTVGVIDKRSSDIVSGLIYNIGCHIRHTITDIILEIKDEYLTIIWKTYGIYMIVKDDLVALTDATQGHGVINNRPLITFKLSEIDLLDNIIEFIQDWKVNNWRIIVNDSNINQSDHPAYYNVNFLPTDDVTFHKLLMPDFPTGKPEVIYLKDDKARADWKAWMGK